MVRLILVAALALALTACNAATFNAGLDRLNTEVASGDAALKRLCPTLRGVTTVAQTMVGDKQQKAFDQVRAALAVACDVPAPDAASAIVVVTLAINAARAARLNGLN